MFDRKIHTPIGVKDILPPEARLKKEVIRRMEDIFDSHGYNAIESPMFEYVEVFSDEKMGSTNPKQMYRFFDREGSELALRSDMTPPIARIAATAYTQTEEPLRFSYTGHVFRYNESYQGKMCERPQAGIELMGIKSIQADAEVLTLAAKCVLSANIKEFRIHIGQVNFFKNILEETGLNQEECDALKSMVAERNYVGVEDLIEDKDINEKTKELFLELPKMVGTMDIIEKASSLTTNAEALKALEGLKELYRYLEIYGLSQYFVFDLGMVSGLNYYTGIIFRGYTFGTGYSIVDGGRYDNLVSQFGKNIPSVGFGIKISEILTVIEQEKLELAINEVKALIGYSKEGMETAIRTADIYRDGGTKVEMILDDLSFEETLEYAEKRDMDSVLYFVDSVNIKYTRIVKDLGAMTSDISIDDLVKPEKEASR